MNTLELGSTGWTLNVLQQDEASPLENHAPFELGSDDKRREIWASEIMLKTYGLRSVKKSCIDYANRRK